ncbi:MAG TPA: hypothetical protein VHC63_14930 [Acidimicrobiales bacterium]|nr:hypothetical protein [Acidimicrobiales bacterium]
MRVLLVVAAVAFGLVLQSEGNGRRLPSRLASATGSPTAGPFTIGGSVEGLFPGAMLSLPLAVHNTNSYSLRITDLAVAVVGVDKSNCPKAAVSSPGFSASTLVGGNATTVIPVTVSMATGVTDACQGAKFTLSFSGHGVRFPLPTSVVVHDARLVVRLTAARTAEVDASLFESGGQAGVVGRTLRFLVGSKLVCTLTTDMHGRGRCSGPAPLLPSHYSVVFAGDASYDPAATSGRLNRTVRIP